MGMPMDPTSHFNIKPHTSQLTPLEGVGDNASGGDNQQERPFRK